MSDYDDIDVVQDMINHQPLSLGHQYIQISQPTFALVSYQALGLSLKLKASK